MSADSSRAVFLSYASQDAEAVQRIAEALRAEGVEVWFDRNELTGGDAWDRKIRQQIRECALFIPVISAATQTRGEGYFRLEWKLAVDRTHLMAPDQPFLLPVVLDDTSDAAARVADEFRSVQWTRLPHGETPPEFCRRVKQLLGKDPAARAPRAVAAQPTGGAKDGARPAVPERSGLPRWWPLAIAVGLAIVGIFWWQSRSVAPPAAGTVRAPTGQTPPAPAIDEKSLAVLPFTNMSDEKDNAFFADGVHEDLLTQLANLSALKVVSRTSVLAYRNPTKSLRQIAAELGVAYVLEGSVRRAGNQIRVTGQLIKAATDEHIWAQDYTRELKDVFAVQSELAREIATALNAKLSPADTASLDVRPTANVGAYDCYQRARVLERSGSDANDVREKIVPLLERAVALDPNYALAWAELAMQRLSLYFAQPTPAGLAAAGDALARAEKIAPDAYEVLDAGVQFAGASRDRDGADARRRRIIALFPNRPEAQLTMAQTALNELRVADAWASYRAALQLDPRNPKVLEEYFFFLDSIRQWDEAEAIGNRQLDVQPDNFDVRLTVASMEFRRSGSTAKLTRLLAELPPGPEAEGKRIQTRVRIALLTGDSAGIVALWRETGPRFKTGGFTERTGRWIIAGAFLRLGDQASARPLLEQNRDELVEQTKHDPASIGGWNNLALTLAMLGDREGARAALERAGKLIKDRPGGPVRAFVPRLEHLLARAWLEEDKGPILQELAVLLREPVPRGGPYNVHVLHVQWSTIPFQGDPRFEAIVNDPKNNAPMF